jgi:hypothetical protein
MVELQHSYKYVCMTDGIYINEKEKRDKISYKFVLK